MKGRLKNRKTGFQTTFCNECMYSGLNLNQDKATKPQTVQIVRQGEATPYWFRDLCKKALLPTTETPTQFFGCFLPQSLLNSTQTPP